MKCRVLNLLTLLSLLLWVIVCALWVRSYWVQDVIVLRKVYGDIHNPDRKFCDLVSSAGGLQFYVGHRIDYHGIGTDEVARQRGFGKGWCLLAESDPKPITYPYIGGSGRYLTGFQLDRFEPYAFPKNRYPRNYWLAYTVVFPHAVPAVGLGALPLVRFVRRTLRYRRSRRNCCPTCAYDLRATPGRCPECGTIAPASAAG